MRAKRIKLLNSEGYYHCICRCVGLQQLLAHSGAKAVLQKMINKAADFSGIVVITYCIMDNHFHLLIRVPPQNNDVSEEELLRRYQSLYESDQLRIEAFIETLKERRLRRKKHLDPSPDIENYIETVKRRMHDVSEFMKTLKQRYTMWYNKNNDRVGTLWTERFKSVLVQDDTHLIATIATYIDLNPVRAGICHRAQEYRWSGLHDFQTKSGIYKDRKMIFSNPEDQSAPQFDYAFYKEEVIPLIEEAEISTETPHAAALEKAKEVINNNSTISIDVSLNQLMKSKIRYLTDGMVIGSNIFLDAILNNMNKAAENRPFRLSCLMHPRKQGESKTLWILRRMRGQIIG